MKDLTLKKNDKTTQSVIQIQCYPYQHLNSNFCRYRRAHPKIQMKFQGTQNS